MVTLARDRSLKQNNPNTLTKKRILILGSSGFLGSALRKQLLGDYDLICPVREELDLFDYKKLRNFIEREKPEIVLNSAGMVAGIQGNIDKPTDLLMSNAQISLNAIRAAHELAIPRYLQFASACVYPLSADSYSHPSDIGAGRIEPTSQSYATAKILAIEAVSAFRRQFGYSWSTIIPSNLYGEGDWNHNADGHVVSMLCKRFISSSRNGEKSISIWGDGKSQRSFLHVEDLAKAVLLMIREDFFAESIVNVCSKNEISIYDLAHEIGQISQFKGEIVFDLSKPNGARRKTLDDTKIRNLGWREETTFSDGLYGYINAMKASEFPS